MLERIILKAVKKHRLSEVSALLEAHFDIGSILGELEDLACRISADEAERIVKAMHPYGEKWSMETITAFIVTKNVSKDECIHYYLVMNMMYNDYRDTAQRHGLDNADFYFELSRDFIEDADAKPYKVERYFDD